MSKTTLGKLLGANGLLFVLFSAVTYFTASAAAAAGLALIGLAMIAAYFATNFGQIGQFASRRSTFFIISSVIAAAIALGALGAVNYVVAKKAKQWDLTAKKIFTLAPQTQSTLKGLKETVHAIGFLPADHPAHDALESLFRRYHDEAPDKFEYSFKDPRKAPDLAARYQLKEGDTTVVLTRGEGAKESHTSLNALNEEELTNALIKLNGVGEQKVYFVAGHGEWPLEAADAEQQSTSLSELKRSLTQEGYAAESLNLAGKAEVPKDAAVLVIAGARAPLTDPEVTALRSYLGEGGRLLYFAEAGREPGAAMNKLLADYGVQVDSGIIADEQFTTGSPYMPVSMFFSDHALVSFLKKMQLNVQLPTARGFSVLHQGMLDGVHAEPVVLTSPYAWEETTPDENPKASPGEKTGSIPLVVAITRPAPASATRRFEEARVVTFGDSEILVDANWGHEGNRNLVMNAFGWASNQVSKITIRPPDRDVSTLDIDKQMMARIHLFTTNLLPLATLALGLSIWLKRRNQ